jgi:preprotein translocase subunit SecD
MKKIVLLVCTAAGGLLFLFVTLAVYLFHPRTALLSNPPTHGSSFVIEADLSHTDVDTNNLAKLKDAIQRRASRFGTKIFWEPISESQVRVMAAITNPEDAQAASRALFSGGVLEFRLVHEESDKLIQQGAVPEGYQLLAREESLPDGSKRIEQLLVKNMPEQALGRNIIKSAMVLRDNLGQPKIDFSMQPEAATAFGALTRKNVGRRLAIVMDGKMYSAPTIQSPIETGRGQISGSFNLREAVELATALDSPLPVRVAVIESKAF